MTEFSAELLGILLVLTLIFFILQHHINKITEKCVQLKKDSHDALRRKDETITELRRIICNAIPIEGEINEVHYGGSDDTEEYVKPTGEWMAIHVESLQERAMKEGAVALKNVTRHWHKHYEFNEYTVSGSWADPVF